MSVPFSNDDTVNRALVSALTRVRNNVDRGSGSTYQLEVEEIVRISRAMQYRGSPNDNEEAALLVAQLDNIRRLESGTETDSTPSPPPTNVTFPTPAIPRNSQVTASTAASRAESAQWPADRLRPSRCVPVDHGVWGLKLVTWELEYCLFQKVFESELSCCLLARQEELRRRLP